eukprot:scaffold30678_cov38-Phaeocystis_antarctica.AAC.2
MTTALAQGGVGLGLGSGLGLGLRGLGLAVRVGGTFAFRRRPVAGGRPRWAWRLAPRVGRR